MIGEIEFEEALLEKIDNFLLKKIKIIIGENVYKEGILKIYNKGNFNFNLRIYNEDKDKVFNVEIPYPFKYYGSESELVLDYGIDTISRGDANINRTILESQESTGSIGIGRFLNEKVTLSEVRG